WRCCWPPSFTGFTGSARRPARRRGRAGTQRRSDPKGFAMPNYVLTFRGLEGRVPTAVEEARWPEWFGKIGGQIVDPGNRVGEARAVGALESRPDALAGYIVITAEDLDAAVAVAEECPMLLQGGGVEV